MTDDARPNPDAILARAKREEHRLSGRGALRIYLGAFAGVGKTYAMLNEAQRRKNYGEDVVVGFVETHGRSQTEAMLQGLEVMPRKRIEYRGVACRGDGRRRNPQAAACRSASSTSWPTRTPPARSARSATRTSRCSCDAGINVVSTLNVQHLESLNDTVASITGVRVRETIPDSVVDDADEIILIDLSPEAARARMEHGNIYPPAQAKAALQSFFRPENLAALREIALRRTAQEVDEQLDEYMRESPAAATSTSTCSLFVDADPVARTLIRRGWRIAQGIHADLTVAYVRRERSEAERTRAGEDNGAGRGPQRPRVSASAAGRRR